MADMARSNEIEQVLRTFLNDCRTGTAHVPSQELLAQHGRSQGARELAALFDAIVGDGDRRGNK